MVKHLRILVVLLVTLASCQPLPDVFTPPTDHTVDENLIHNYVYKLYFSLLGREPNINEAEQAITALKASNMAEDDRRAIISSIQNTTAYYTKIAAEARNEYLNGLTSADIDKKNREIYGWMFQGLVDSAFSSDLTQGILQYKELNLAAAQLEDGSITMGDLHRRCVSNYTYTQINMGTDNFVKSCFLNFMFRYPTEYELAQASQMVDGGDGVLFMKKASGREGFLELFFNSANYHEGLIANMYRKYLLRKPEPIELAAHLAEYEKHQNFKKIQESILASDEFAGLVKYIPDPDATR